MPPPKPPAPPAPPPLLPPVVPRPPVPGVAPPVGEPPVPGVAPPVERPAVPGVAPPVGEPPVPGVAPPVGTPPVPDPAPPVGTPPVPDPAPPVGIPPVPDAAPPVGTPPVPDAPPVESRPPLVTPPVPGLPLVPGFPLEIPDPPAPARTLASVGEPPRDVHEAAAKTTKAQVHSAFNDFMVLLWAVSPSGSLSSLPKRALTSRPHAMGKGGPDNLRQAQLNPRDPPDEGIGRMKFARNSAPGVMLGVPCLDFRPRFGGSGCAL